MLKFKTQKSKPIFFAAFMFGVVLTLILALLWREFDSGKRQVRQILGSTIAGFNYLEQGNLNEAHRKFAAAQSEINSSREVLLQALKLLPPGNDLERILSAGIDLTAAGTALEIGKQTLTPEVFIGSDHRGTSFELFNFLRDRRTNLLQASNRVSLAATKLGEVNPNRIPSEYRGKFLEAFEKLRTADQALRKILDTQEILLRLLGDPPKTYLLIFQNNNEARATGGFIGTYGLLKFGRGTARIEKIESIYALDGQLFEKIAAPGPLQRQVSQHWALRDSNWFADFPESARKMLEFLEKEGKILADGVIALTPDVFEDLLVLTGPVPIPEYDRELTAANFREVVQFETSENYDRRLNEPKKFLADFTPRFLEKLTALSADNTPAVLEALRRLGEEKQILLFSLDPKLQNIFAEYRLDGAVRHTSGDYLAIYHSNVGGGKTDQHIRQTVEKSVSIDSGGLAIVKLKITRTHLGFAEKYFPKNLDFMRIFAPRQAKLLAASGFDDFALPSSSLPDAATDSDLKSWDTEFTRDEKTAMYIGAEAGYRVFANWLELLPGQSKTVELTYEMQFDAAKNYTMLLQKQPGARAFDFSLAVSYLSGEIAYFYPSDFVERDKNRLRLSERVNSDRFYGLVGE